jgi:DNA adenine methylase
MPTARRITLRREDAPKIATRPAAVPAPIVKWAGGKTKLLGQLMAARPRAFRRYFEPFLGGGALFFHLAPPVAVLNDSNEDLINTYRCVAWNVEAVIRRLATHRKKHCEEHFYDIRSRWNDRKRKQSDVQRAAAFIYLNKTCYNGLWRVNSKGLFNVPMGRYDSPQVFDAARLRAASRALQRAEFHAGHFADCLDQADAGDFIYFDPPYHPVTDTANFTSYTSDSFAEDDQRELARAARALAARGCAVMISNSDTPFIRQLYRGFRILRVAAPRAINSKANLRGEVSEVLISNHYAARGLATRKGRRRG